MEIKTPEQRQKELVRAIRSCTWQLWWMLFGGFAGTIIAIWRTGGQ